MLPGLGCLIVLVVLILTCIACKCWPTEPNLKKMWGTRDKYDHYRYDYTYPGGLVVMWILLAVFSIVTIICLTNIGVGHYDLKKQDTNIKIVQSKIDNLLPIVNDKLAEYPQYEKQILATYKKGTWVSIPPVLKADAVFMQMAENIEAYHATLYEIEVAKNNSRISMLMSYKTALYLGILTAKPSAKDLGPVTID